MDDTSADVDGADLLHRALAGHDGALDGLARRLLPILRTRVRLATARARAPLGPFEVDDLVHEIWIELFADGARRLSAYSPSRGVSLAGWVGLVADRQLASFVRKASAQKRGRAVATIDATDELPTPEPDPEARVLAEDLAMQLAAHVEHSLPAPGRRVLRCTFAGDRTAIEVAHRLGVSVQVVYNWQHRIRRVAREFVVGRVLEKVGRDRSRRGLP